MVVQGGFVRVGPLVRGRSSVSRAQVHDCNLESHAQGAQMGKIGAWDAPVQSTTSASMCGCVPDSCACVRNCGVNSAC
jgi:hypothetical protein